MSVGVPAVVVVVVVAEVSVVVSAVLTAVVERPYFFAGVLTLTGIRP